MNKYNFNKIINRRNTSSYKWDVNEDEISLTIADMDFSVMDEIKKSVLEVAEISAYGYRGVPQEYFQAYVHHFERRYGARFTIEDCIFSAGIVGSIDSILKRIANKGDGVVMLTPIYNVFFNCIKNNGLNLINVPFKYEQYKYDIDWPLLQESIKKAKVFILCNPHNPIGKRFNEDELIRIVELCEKNNVYLLSDEIHADFDYNGTRYVPVNKISDYNKLISLYSPGKTFNLAGLHSSIIVVKDSGLREKIQKGIYEDDIGEPGYFSIEPVIVAYEKGETYIEELNDYLNKNREFVRENLDKSLKLVENESTYLLWIDVSQISSSNLFVEELRKVTGLLVAPGDIYGDDRFIRVNIATSLEMVKDAINRLNKFVKNKI